MSGRRWAALVRSRPGRLRIRDFAACSSSARDAAGLLVTGIGPDRNRGQRELALARGTHRLVARKDGLVRSFAELVEVP